MNQCPECNSRNLYVEQDEDKLIYSCRSCRSCGFVSESKYEKTKSGVKFDKDKLRYDLIPPDALEELVKVYTYGASKYADRNWEKGMKWGRIYGGIMRHLWKFWSGTNRNPEDDNLYHLAQAAWGCLTLLTYVLREKGEDDRK